MAAGRGVITRRSAVWLYHGLVARRSAGGLRLSRRRSCAAYGCGRALRSYAALCRPGMGFCGVLRSFVALRFRGGVLAPLVLVGAALWQPPAAKEGQGDCDFPLGPPWILLYPLKRRRSARGGGGRATRSYAALCRRSKGWVRCSAFCRCFSDVAAAFLRRWCLRAQPCGSLRRPRRDRGIAISGSALCAYAPSVPCGCTAAALQSRCARPTRALLGFSFTP